MGIRAGYIHCSTDFSNLMLANTYFVSWMLNPSMQCTFIVNRKLAPHNVKGMLVLLNPLRINTRVSNSAQLSHNFGYVFWFAFLAKICNLHFFFLGLLLIVFCQIQLSVFLRLQLLCSMAVLSPLVT